MTNDMRSAPGDHDTIDHAIDDAVQTMSAVDGAFEARSRAQVHGRLGSSSSVAMRTRVDDAPHWTLRRLAPWAAALSVALIVVLWANLWINQSREPRHVVEHPRPVASAPPGQAVREAAPTAPLAIATSTATVTQRVRPRAHRTGPRRPATPANHRLAEFVRAIQQLPPEVWERIDAAGPPVITELAPAGPSPIAPIAIDQLPGSAWTDAQPATPPGEPR
jgi:hypothetical protein